MPNTLKYRKAWSWPFRVEEFIAGHIKGFTVHVMNGTSQMGDLRIDKYTTETNIKADVLFLPLKDEIADTVVCDPPWSMDFVLRIPLVAELRRILKFGGALIFNAPWSPKMPGLRIEAIYIPDWQLISSHNVIPIFLVRKVKSRLL